ncbi:aminotransferase DegT [Leptospira kobayashii]|uniref:Aminotransferase DegT n=1 Tax=Leptospira kobayashii TaxID=1917830 RepID=A0ABM7UK62_9LEPT|nr:DegT/DnrJ/EryC1/StrS family aminotransferase [Leptospira kobayashii]BDA79201.1 aminotransferase DegT [Leptospira kobayashii]
MINHNRPSLGQEEIDAAAAVIRSNYLVSSEQIERFENEFCDYLGLDHGSAVVTSTGTSALFLALLALDAKSKKVAFPSYVCSALRNAVALASGNEVLLDIEKNGPNIDIEALNKSKPDIAIIPHLYGQPVTLDKIDKDILIIEDCCQSIGGTYKSKSLGTIGDIGIFSFYATKLLTSGGQGGMVVSKDKSKIAKIKDYLDFDGRVEQANRFGFPMTEMQAAIGRVQLKKLNGFLSRRKEIFHEYESAGLNMMKSVPGSIYYRSVMYSENPVSVIEKLKQNDIKAIVPIEDWEILGKKEDFPNALRMSKNTVSLPCYPSLTDAELEKIIKVLR